MDRLEGECEMAEDNTKPQTKADDYRALAEQCFRQAGATIDREVANTLRLMGRDYVAKAAEALEKMKKNG